MTTSPLYTVRPIERWPGERTREQVRSPFSAALIATRTMLARELSAIGATDVVLQVDITESMLRNDGELRSGARPMSSAVILSFQSGGEHLSFPCDKFLLWHHNLRAIALTLEALRKVGRYGVVRRNEQYTGWKAIGLAPESEFSNRIMAAQWMMNVQQTMNLGEGITVQAVLNDPERYYRRLAKVLHPDGGGNDSDFIRLQNAFKVITEARAHA